MKTFACIFLKIQAAIIAAGGTSSAAVTRDGRLYTWGSGGVGGGVLASKGGALTDAVYRRSALAQAAATRGPWKWGGEGPVLFFRGGRI